MNLLSDFDFKKAVFLIPYAAVAYIGNRLSWLYRMSPGDLPGQKILFTVSNMGYAGGGAWPNFNLKDILVGIEAAVFFALLVAVKRQDRKKYRPGIEYGSARWGTPQDIKPLMDKKEDRNIILTATESLSMKTRPPKGVHFPNKNVLVIGGSGSGKTRFFVKPNLMQLHSSYVVTDPKGTLVLECGKMFEKAGYKIKILNTVNFKKSMHYNPFFYILIEKDISSFVSSLVKNTKSEGASTGEDFWVKAEILYLTALVGYIWYEAPEEEQNFDLLLDLINASETREDDENFKNAVDLLFEDLERRDKDNFAVRQYKKYKLAAGKTAKSILISCGARLSPFDIKEVRDLLSDDDMELELMGDRKTVLFVIISDTDDTFNFIVNILYTQLFKLLFDRADDYYKGRLPIHVRFILDEFANIGQIPEFYKRLSTMRSREISASVILQSKSQIKAIYKEQAKSIEENCDSMLFLGGRSEDTLKEISEVLGKQTINVQSESESKGTTESHGQNTQKTGRELLTKDEIAVLKSTHCILQIQGIRPFLSKKYDITKHKRYKELKDFDDKNEFNAEDYVKKKLKLKKDDRFDLYEVNLKNKEE